jgi:small subunit ribosomal protein S7
MRRRRAEPRERLPDAKYGNAEVGEFINKIMLAGKKSAAEKIVYKMLDEVNSRLKVDPLKVFLEALANIGPQVEVKSRRVGGANYQVPVEVRPDRRRALAMRKLIEMSRKRKEKSMWARLLNEVMDAAQNRGAAVKWREDTHKMAEANRAFAHFRW